MAIDAMIAWPLMADREGARDETICIHAPEPGVGHPPDETVIAVRARVAALIMLAGCGFPRPADVAGEDFTVTLDVARVHVVEGASATVGVKLSQRAAAEPVNVTVAGLPPGLTADPLTIAGAAGELTLHAAASAAQGEAALTVTAATTDHSHDVALSLVAMGPSGTLDHSFGAGGMLPIPLACHGDAIVVQPDGKIVVAGVVADRPGIMVARYLPDGAADQSFSGGMVVFNTGFLKPAMALQRDGKIVVATAGGTRSPIPLVVRLNADGSHDQGFGQNGESFFSLSTNGESLLNAVVIQPEGGILVAGRTHVLEGSISTEQAVVARLTPTGVRDDSFGTNGRTTTSLGAEESNFLTLVLQPDGGIIAVGTTGIHANPDQVAAVARLHRDGGLDSSFSGDGFFTIELGDVTAPSAALQPDGKIVYAGGVGGGNTGDTYLMRLNGNDGSLDASFGSNGTSRVNVVAGQPDFASGLALQPDGRFIIVGQAEIAGFPNAFVARLGTNSLFDRSFAGGVVAPVMRFLGVSSAQFQAVALDADGRILATGFLSGSSDELILYRFWP